MSESSVLARVKTALATLNVPLAVDVYQTSTGAALPGEYITFFLVFNGQEQAANDLETLRSYLVQVSYFNKLGLGTVPGIQAAMLAAGFLKADSRQLPMDEQSRHFGLAMDFNYLEEE